jgi:HEAT repeat protein
MTSRARATEIPKLVRRLGSRRPTVVDSARARLAIIGARAVAALAESLEGDNNRIRANAMPLLALIHDARGREPLMAMLLDHDPRLREIAARSLARFSSQQTVVALERLLDKERSVRVRVAAVRALIEQYAAGQDHAIRQVVEILFDADEDPRLRDAALGLLPLLPASERRGILRRLRQDPCRELSARARELEHTPPAPLDATATVHRRIRALASDDYATWNEAVHRLSAVGVPAAVPLVEEMQRRAHDPEYCVRAGMVLKGLGPRRGRCLAEALDRVEEPLPLQVLVEVAGALGDKSLIYRLKNLIDRIAENREVPAGRDGFDPMQRVRAKAHLELARVGSRLAIADLREALSGQERRLEPEMVDAVERIGKKDEIPDLLRAYLREDRFLKDRVEVAVRAIMKRERIRRNNRMFHSLSPRQVTALEAILPPVRSRRTSSRRKPKR